MDGGLWNNGEVVFLKWGSRRLQTRSNLDKNSPSGGTAESRTAENTLHFKDSFLTEDHMYIAAPALGFRSGAAGRGRAFLTCAPAPPSSEPDPTRLKV